MEEHSFKLEYYVNIDDEETAAIVRELLSALPLEQLIEHTLNATAITQPVMLTLVVTDDKSIQDLNRQYRQQDKATDVLSFPLLEKPLVNAPADQLWMTFEDSDGEATETTGAAPAFVTPSELPTNLGDIVISWPTVVRQAAKSRYEPGYELLYLLAHGVLHLIGYDDQTEAGYAAMVSLQRVVLESMGWKA